MVAVRLSPFGGMVPAVDDHLLADTNAALSQNAWTYDGTVVGLPELKLLRTNLSAGTSKVYRIPNNYTDGLHLGDAFFMEFPNTDTDVIRSLVFGDTFDRYYWASPVDVPRYNTKAGIVAGLPAWMLGIPAPVSQTATPTGGASATLVSRAYVTTYVSTYAEEGPVSPPTLISSMKIDASVNLTFPAADPNDLGVNRTLAQRRIYRTITATDGTTTYFLVATLPITTLTYSDTMTDLVLSANALLQSTNWTGPPSDLKGWVSMSNGIVAGWRNNEIWFCEPFRPHAWPAAYVLTVEYPIVGMGVTNQTLVVLTNGYPHTVTGINPASMTLTKLAGLLPCTSRGSIVSSTSGVYFSSPQGLALVGQGGVLIATKELIRKDKWNALVATSTLRAVQLGPAYFAFGSARFGVFEPTAFEITAFAQQDFSGARNGLLLDPTSQSVAFNLLTSVDPIVNIMMDAWSGEVLIIKNGATYWLDIGDAQQQRAPYTWRSKIFQTSTQDNFQAMKVYFTIPPNTPALGPTPNTSMVQTLASNQYGIIRMYADDNLIFVRELRKSGEMFRLPSGFKAEFWQFEIEARVKITNFQAATSPSELRTV
jgi:hypothetical protein